MAQRKISALGLEKLKQWEGLRLRSYQDEAGVWTIGYGSTGPHVKPGMKIDADYAEKLLKRDLARFEERVHRLVKVALNDNQFAALVSFDFNTGALDKSTLLKKLSTGDYGCVPSELMKWVKTTDPRTGKKKVSQGLVNRRAAECGLWSAGAPVASANVEVHAYDKPILTKENIAMATPVLAGVGSAGALFEGGGPVQYAIAAAIFLSFAVGLWFFIKKRVDPK